MISNRLVFNIIFAVFQVKTISALKVFSKKTSGNLLWIFLIVTVSGCNVTRNLPEDRYLLDKYRIGVDNRRINKKELNTYVRQKPNSRVFGLRIPSRLYNLGGIFQKIGEEPVVYDPEKTQRTVRQLKLYLRNKGYHHARVKDSLIVKKQKATVHYRIEPREPYVIGRIRYNFRDTALKKYVLPDTINSLLEPGMIFDVDHLQDERERIAGMLKNQGFYDFSSEYIRYIADTAMQGNRVEIVLDFNKYPEPVGENRYISRRHRRYKIRSVKIYTAHDPRQVLVDRKKYLAGLDSMVYKGLMFKFRDELKVRPEVLSESVYIFPGDQYELELVNETYNHLSNLRIFRLVNIGFHKTGRSAEPDSGLYPLDCVIELTPSTLQSYTVELEGTNSSGNLGAAGNLIYQHRNLLRGAENFDFRLKGATEAIKESKARGFANTLELGAEIRLHIPKFILPFKTERFTRKYNPRTTVSTAYNFQRRPDYTRTIANATFGYNWRGSDYVTHIINPIELNFVNIPYTSDYFGELIENTYFKYSYQDHLIMVTNYSYIFNNQDIKKQEDFYYLRFNAESAGNLLSGLNKLTGARTYDDRYRFFGNEYAQYAKADIDFRYYRTLNANRSIVYRIFVGVGAPYGNSRAIPFEKQYFSGGANGVRAWQVRDLGPGSYEEEINTRYPNQTADIKIESNLEYRFKLFWVLEGALFLDAGNIWLANEDRERKGARFAWDDFYHDLAVGAGFGARFDFSFFIFRLDLGIKARDPVLPRGEKWIPGNRQLTSDDVTLHLAIGYPF